MDDIDIILLSIVSLAIGLGIFLLCGRLIGWALGISEIAKNQQTIITQNRKLREMLEYTARIQYDIAINQGIKNPGAEKEEAEQK